MRRGSGGKLGIRNEGGGFAASMYGAMPEGGIYSLVLRMSIKRTFNRHANVVRMSARATCFPLRGKCRRQ